MPALRSARGRRTGTVSEERSHDVEACREAALRLLERTRRTRSDLERRLAEKGFAAPIVGDVLDRLAGVGLVDDVEYARAYLSGRWGRRPAGWRRLEQDLRRRGVCAEDVAQARLRLEAVQGAADEVTAARKVVAQAARRYAKLAPRMRRQRLYALLARRGFDGDTIEAALAPDPEDSAQ
ncbi:MAG TPA: regulatory protein RecX [Candidatus Limnocylindria bacterium]|nr:regulatory protein RecX [Candidatus Limnocylindria bacterium]